MMKVVIQHLVPVSVYKNVIILDEMISETAASEHAMA